MKIPEIRQALRVASENLSNYLDNGEEFSRKHAEVTELQAKLQRALQAEEAQRGLAAPHAAGADAVDPTKSFRNFGEQLGAIMRARVDGVADPRLQRAPVGSGEVRPAAASWCKPISRTPCW
jgi:hypothetical protein